MADRYAQVLVRIWKDPDWVARSPRAQWFYLLLISQANINRAGVIDLTAKRWADLSVGADERTIESATKELEQHEFIIVDRSTEEILVRSMIRNGGIANQPNVLKAALRQAQEVNSQKIRVVLAVELRRLGQPIADAVASILDGALGTHPPDPSANPSSNPSSNPNAKGKAAGREPFVEPFVEPRGTGKGLGSSSPVNINSSFKPSSSKIATKDRWTDPDVIQLCAHLHSRVTTNGSKATITDKWRDAARLIIDRDNRDLTEALKLIDWCQDHHFWRTNVLSMPTFRKHYDKLRLQSQDRHLKAVVGGYVGYQGPSDNSVYHKGLLP